MNYKNLFELIKKMVFVPTISGFEATGLKKIAEIVNCYCENTFDKTEINPVSGMKFTKYAKGPTAKKLVFDAHIDTIGFLVSEICENGFLRVVPVGGIDKRLLPSSEVVIYGKKEINGVFISTPAHLVEKGDENKINFKKCFIVDIAMTKSEAEKYIRIGTPIGFFPKVEMLQNDMFVSISLDDKLCAAALCDGIKNSDNKNVEIVLNLSCGEETSSVGAKISGFVDKADAAVVMDVEFAKSPGIADKDCVIMGYGPNVCYSSTTNRNLTDLLYESAFQRKIKIQQIVGAKSTGTNAHILQTAFLSTPTGVMSIPIKNMHTPAEIASLSDVSDASEIISAFIEDFEKFDCGLKVLKDGDKI